MTATVHNSRDEKRNQRWLDLLLDVALVANEAESMDGAITTVMARVCQHNGWYAGYSHVSERRHGIWWLEPLDEGSLGALASQLSPLTREWSQQVMASGRTELIDDFGDCDYPFEDSEAELPTSGGAIATPLLVGPRAVGAMVFVSRHRLSKNLGRAQLQDLIEIMDGVGTQMGRVVERWHLARRIAAETERERHELGQQIHDGIAQQLVGVKLLAQNLRKRMRRVTKEFDKDWDLLLDSLAQAQNEARAVARGLSAGMVYSGPDSLIEQLEDLCQVAESGHGVECRLEVRGEIGVDDEITGAHLLRIAREAVMNALRHANPSRIEIDLSSTDEESVLEIRDDGSGLTAEASLSAGMGLLGMRYRAAAIGGRIELESIPGKGTVVRCLV